MRGGGNDSRSERAMWPQSRHSNKSIVSNIPSTVPRFLSLMPHCYGRDRMMKKVMSQGSTMYQKGPSE